jgi:predicted solute-binding protein
MDDDQNLSLLSFAGAYSEVVAYKGYGIVGHPETISTRLVERAFGERRIAFDNTS